MQRGAEGSRSLRMATQHYYERVPQEHAWAQSGGRATEPRHPQGEEGAPLRCVAFKGVCCLVHPPS